MAHINVFEPPTVAISDDERAFINRLGARVAELHKARDITQVQLAEQMGLSQQRIHAYETGYRRFLLGLDTAATGTRAGRLAR